MNGLVVHVGIFFSTEQFSILSKRLLNERRRKMFISHEIFPHSFDRWCWKVNFHITYQKTIIMDIKKKALEIVKFLNDHFYINLPWWIHFCSHFFPTLIFFLLLVFLCLFKNRNFFFFEQNTKKKYINFHFAQQENFFSGYFSTQIFSNKNFFYIIFVLFFSNY